MGKCSAARTAVTKECYSFIVFLTAEESAAFMAIALAFQKNIYTGNSTL